METESHHLSEFLELDVNYDRVSHMKRLANYIIDLFGFYIVITILAIFMAFYYPSFLGAIVNDGSGMSWISNLFSLLIYALYMGTIETIFKGRSLGKLITGTRAVNLDGSIISGKTAFLRGFIRAIPFEAFSALGSPSTPWHDKWTDTMVTNNVKRSELI